jgi:hypothetical protein
MMRHYSFCPAHATSQHPFTAKSNSHPPKGLALQLGRQSKKRPKWYIPASFAASRKECALL